jgi:uroporphyrinogen-III synthase
LNAPVLNRSRTWVRCYEDFFSAHNYTPTFIPVLEHRFLKNNLTQVRDHEGWGVVVCGEEVFVAIVWGGFCFQEENWCWRHGMRDLFSTGAFNNATRKYGGLIFTSQRAVEGFAQMRG